MNENEAMIQVRDYLNQYRHKEMARNAKEVECTTMPNHGLREITVTANGLTAILNELIALRANEMKTVNDGVKVKRVPVPDEEKFANVDVRPIPDGKFIVQIYDSQIDAMNTNMHRMDKTSDWEQIS